MLKTFPIISVVLLFAFAVHAQLENPRFGERPFAERATRLDDPDNTKVYRVVKSATGEKTMDTMAQIIRKETSCETKAPAGATSPKGDVSPVGDTKIVGGCESLAVPAAQTATEDKPVTQTGSGSGGGKNIIYFGAGVSRKSDGFDSLGSAFGDFSDNEVAFTFGYLRVSNKSRLLGGADISYEGTKLDGTYGSYSTEGAFSFNGIVGANVAKNDSVRFDVAGLLGAREKTVDCPASYLGFACYADRPPDRSYTVNYGGILSFSYKKLVVGARLTGASTQGLLGLRF